MDRHLELSCSSCSTTFGFKDSRNPQGNRCPLLLKCGHSMCEGCLKTLRRSQRKELKCNVCSAVHAVTKSSDLREDFPLNVYTVGQVSLKHFAPDTSKGMDSVIGFYKPPAEVVTLCCECNLAKPEWMCRKCDNHPYCENCFIRVHNGGVVLRTHERVPFSEAEKKLDDELMCDVHPGQVLVYYCEDCSKYSCQTCLKEKHDNHTHISIGEKNSELFQEFSDAYDEAYSVLMQLKASKKKLQNNTPFKDEEALTIKKQISVHFNHLHGILQLMEKEYLKNIESCEENVHQSLQNRYLDIEESIQEMENILSESKQFTETNVFINTPLFSNLQKLKNISAIPCHITLNTDIDNTKFGFYVVPDVDVVIKGLCTVTVPINRVYELRSRSDNMSDTMSIASTKPLLIKPDVLNHFIGMEERQLSATPPELNNTCPSNTFQSEIKTKKSSQQDILKKRKASAKVVSSEDNVSIISADSEIENICRLPPLVEGSSENVKLCHLISPNDFYIHRESSFHVLEKLWKTFSRKSKIITKVPDTVELGHTYLVQYDKDNNWYRAKVQNMTQSKCEIFYIDYGNTETVENQRLREIPEKYLEIPHLAIHCSLYSCVPLGGQWDEKAIQMMAHLSSSVQLSMSVVVYDMDNDLHHVTLYRCNEGIGSFADILAFLHFAKQSKHEPSIYDNQIRTNMYTNITIERNERFDAQVTHINSPSSFYIRKITSDEIFVKLSNELNSIYSRINEKELLIYNPYIDMPVVAKYKDGEWYRAKVIKIPEPRSVRVRYVDYGNEETVSWTDIRLTQPKFMKMGIQGLHCLLSDVQPKHGYRWSTGAIKVFQNLAKKNVLFHIFVHDITQTSLSIILSERLPNKEICFNGVLVKRGHAKSTGLNSARAEYELKPEINFGIDSSSQKSSVTRNDNKTPSHTSRNARSEGKSHSSQSELMDDDASSGSAEDTERVKIKILKYVSPDEIYVTFESTINKIARLTEEMTHVYQISEPELRNWKENDLCAVLSKNDNNWYRGLILEASENIYQVFIKDIVKSVEAQESDLRVLDPQFMDVMDGSIRCHLTAVIPAGGTKIWSASSYDYMTKRFEIFPDLYMKKLGPMENKSLPIQLLAKYSKSGGPMDPVIEEWKDISQILIDCGFAFPDKKSQYYSALKRNDNEDTQDDEDVLRYTFDLHEEPDDDTPFSSYNPRNGKVNQRNSQEALKENNTTTSVGKSFEKYGFNKVPSLKTKDKITDWKPAEPFENLQLRTVPSYVDYECSIYLQDPRKSKHELDRIQKALTSLYDGSTPKPQDLVWTEGDLCIAYYDVEKIWCRGKVLNVLEEEKIKVIFVDYGNIEIVEPGVLRKQIWSEDIPIQCHRCVIPGLIPISNTGKWDVGALGQIHATVVQQECEVQLLPPEIEGGDYIIEKLVLPCGNNLLEWIISMQYATYIVDCSQLRAHTKNMTSGSVPMIKEEKASKSSEVATHLPGDIDLLPDSTGPENKTPYVNNWIEQMLLSSETDDVPSYREWILPEGVAEVQITVLSVTTDCSVIVNIEGCDDTEVTEVLDEFCILQQEIEEEAEKQPTILKPVKGQACVSCFTSDNVWYRALILDVYDNDRVKVSYVDYGNEELISVDRLRRIKEGWMNTPKQAIRAALYNLTSGPNGALKVFETLSSVFTQPPYMMSIEKRQPDLQVDIVDSSGELPYQPLIDLGILSRQD